MKVIDCRGLSCPQPVIETKRVLDGMQGAIVEVIVDNPAARENVTRFAQSQGCQVESGEKGKDFFVRIGKGRGEKEDTRQRKEEGDMGHTIFLIAADTIGKGSEELGRTLMKSFFYALAEAIPRPETIIFMNSGVKLATERAPELESLERLEKAGVSLLVCGTCLNYFELKDKLKAGRVSNMYEIVETMMGAGKVIAP